MIIEVLPNLWIGSRGMLEDSNFLYQKHIKAQINLENDLGFLNRSCEYQDVVRKNIEKYDIIKSYQYFDKATEYIYQKIKKSEGVLMVCATGIEKCPSLLLAYLIRYGGLQKPIGVQMIRTKILLAFEKGIFGEKGLDYFISKI